MIQIIVEAAGILVIGALIVWGVRSVVLWVQEAIELKRKHDNAAGHDIDRTH
jgi:hypothetical protein